jgi:thiamine-phosphate pyrophosphorylase
MKLRPIYRMMDANFNRAREGLRVCEEITRFYLSDRILTAKIKKARHRVTGCLKALPVSYQELLQCRDVEKDVGQGDSGLENNKKNIKELFLANSQRTKESLRVLEEMSRLINISIASEFKKIRFYVYGIEKNVVSKLEALRDNL